MIVAAVYDHRRCGPRHNGWIGRSPGTPQFHGCGANEAPRRRALLLRRTIATRLTQAHPLTKPCDLIKQEIYIAMQMFFGAAF